MNNQPQCKWFDHDNITSKLSSKTDKIQKQKNKLVDTKKRKLKSIILVINDMLSKRSITRSWILNNLAPKETNSFFNNNKYWCLHLQKVFSWAIEYSDEKKTNVDDVMCRKWRCSIIKSYWLFPFKEKFLT